MFFFLVNVSVDSYIAAFSVHVWLYPGQMSRDTSINTKLFLSLN